MNTPRNFCIKIQNVTYELQLTTVKLKLNKTHLQQPSSNYTNKAFKLTLSGK